MHVISKKKILTISIAVILIVVLALYMKRKEKRNLPWRLRGYKQQIAFSGRLKPVTQTVVIKRIPISLFVSFSVSTRTESEKVKGKTKRKTRENRFDHLTQLIRNIRNTHGYFYHEQSHSPISKLSANNVSGRRKNISFVIGMISTPLHKTPQWAH